MRSTKPPAYPFGERLRKSRTDAGLSTAALAELIGATQSTVAHAELHGQGSTYVCRIARACGVDPYWLETGQNETPQDNKPHADKVHEPQQPRHSTKAEELATTFDEAPLGRSTKSTVHRLCMTIVRHGGLPAYSDLKKVSTSKVV